MSGAARENAVPYFIKLRPTRVIEMGGMNNAAVFEVVAYRCSLLNAYSIEDETGRWYRATKSDMSDRTGLTERQVGYALDALIEDGFLDKDRHWVDGNWDRTLSYRPRWNDDNLSERTQTYAPSSDDDTSASEDTPVSVHVRTPVSVPPTSKTSKTSRESPRHSVSTAPKESRKKSPFRNPEPAEDDTSTGGDNDPPVHGAAKRKRAAPNPDPAPGAPPTSGGMAARLARGLDKLGQGEVVNQEAIRGRLTEDRKVTGGPTAEVQSETIDIFVRSHQQFIAPGSARTPLWLVYLNNRVRLREQAERVLAAKAVVDVTKTPEWAEMVEQGKRTMAEYEAGRAVGE